MNKAPAFQLYADDFQASTAGLSPDAVGVLIKLLCVLWSQSKDQYSIIDDDTFISRIAGISIEEWKRIRAELQHPERPQFEEENGRLVSRHLRQQAQRQNAYREKQLQNSLKGVAARSAQRQPIDQPSVDPSVDHSVNPTDNHSVDRSVDPPVAQRTTFPIPIPNSEFLIQIPKEKNKDKRSDVLNGHRTGFEKFWNAYPKKRGKGQAEKEWGRLKPDDAHVAIILTAIDKAKQTPDWRKENGQFIPHPAKWLKAKGWEDEYPESPHTGINSKNFREGGIF